MYKKDSSSSPPSKQTENEPDNIGEYLNDIVDHAFLFLLRFGLRLGFGLRGHILVQVDHVNEVGALSRIRNGFVPVSFEATSQSVLERNRVSELINFKDGGRCEVLLLQNNWQLHRELSKRFEIIVCEKEV